MNNEQRPENFQTPSLVTGSCPSSVKGFPFRASPQAPCLARVWSIKACHIVKPLTAFICSVKEVHLKTQTLRRLSATQSNYDPKALNNTFIDHNYPIKIPCTTTTATSHTTSTTMTTTSVTMSAITTTTILLLIPGQQQLLLLQLLWKLKKFSFIITKLFLCKCDQKVLLLILWS